MFSVLFRVFLFALPLNQIFVATTPADDDDLLIQSSDVTEFDMPESCKKEGKSFCFEKGDNYPTELIDTLLEDMQILQIQNSESAVDIGARLGDSYDEPDCPTESTYKPIYYIIDTNGNVRVVVQSPKKLEQIYNLKWCSQEGRLTKNTAHFLKSTTLEQFNIECVTTNSNIDFFVLSEGPEPKIEVALVKGGIPVCCRCRYNTKL